MSKLIALSLVLFGTPLLAKGDGDFTVDLDGGEESLTFDDAGEEGGWFSLSSIGYSVDYDGLFSDDIFVQRASANIEYEYERFTLGLTYSRSEYDIEYSPISTGFAESLDEETDQFSLNLGWEWNDSFSSGLSLSGYKGFTDFRSIWISNFWRQSFQFFSAYEEPDPEGLSVTLSNTYVLPNQIDSITLDLGYSNDRVAPGWEISTGPDVFGLISSNDRLETYSASLTGNFYITNKVTSQFFVRAAFVTDREVRTQYRANFAWNPLDRLTFRGELGLTFESPDFDAVYGGVSAHWQLLDSLEFSLGFRAYADSGEITTTNFNSSAPGSDTREVSASLLWNKGFHSVRASVAYFQSNFDPVQIANLPFANLFQDRDFIAVRAAYSYQF